MKICPSCQVANNDDAVFCSKCGADLTNVPVINAAAADNFDHTSEFDSKDISDNKVIAMLPYLFGVIGVIIALLASKDSKYAMFHARQALKIEVIAILLMFVNIIPIIGQIAFVICELILVVLEIIAFFQVCGGKAKEPAIIRNLGFLK